MIYKGSYARGGYKNASGVETGLEYLDKIIGKEGLKTDVSVNIPPTVYIYTGIALFVGIVGAILVSKKLGKK